MSMLTWDSTFPSGSGLSLKGADQKKQDLRFVGPSKEATHGDKVRKVFVISHQTSVSSISSLIVVLLWIFSVSCFWYCFRFLKSLLHGYDSASLDALRYLAVSSKSREYPFFFFLHFVSFVRVTENSQFWKTLAIRTK